MRRGRLFGLGNEWLTFGFWAKLREQNVVLRSSCPINAAHRSASLVYQLSTSRSRWNMDTCCQSVGVLCTAGNCNFCVRVPVNPEGARKRRFSGRPP
jgi:hypothetical protein